MLQKPTHLQIVVEIPKRLITMAKGLISHIQRYSIHDGPGIRTLVFFKGCPLTCLWCSNPETQKSSPEVLYSKIKCKNCDHCLSACNLNAIEDIDGGKAINRSLCDTCGMCVEACPNEALEIAGRSMTTEEVLIEVEKDMVFYRSSGGGITLSGGESLSQPEFSTKLLRDCYNRGIHTALETCGYQTWETLATMLPYTDLVLYDLKCMDPEKHKLLTGVSNRIILENARKVASEKIPMIVRLPVIPGYTDSEANIKAAAEFIATLDGVTEVDLLPYHRLGEAKYEKLGIGYHLEGLSPPSNEQMKAISLILESYGLKTHIGG
jgi:pyruvate formate lyase activating enzyme